MFAAEWLMHRFSFLPLAALLALASLASPAFLAAQEARGVLAGLAAYEGADRHQRLLEGARREGFLSLYTSFPPRTSQN